MKKIIACILAFAVAIACGVLFVSCDKTTVEADGSANVRALVVGSGADADEAYNQLCEGLIANIDVSRSEAAKGLERYDIVYLSDFGAELDTSAVESYVYSGGTVVLDNELVREFSNEFLGAEAVVDIEGCPVDLSYPEPDADLQDISDILYNYTDVLKDYENFDRYAEYSYGVGILPSTAKTIAGYNDAAIYTINRYGSGNVFITNPLLPGKYTVSSLIEQEEGEPLAYTTVSAGSLLRSYYAEYVSKEKYGFAVERTFGSFGTKPAAWELHYEDITGIKNDSLEEFAKLCMSEWQIPSYTLARNFYTWFKRAESLTYLKYDGKTAKNDAYEGVYCSGTHVVTGGKWLELDSYNETESYFDDDAQYTKRLYPCPIDWNEDGTIDFICGSADGRFYYFEGRGVNGNFETGIATLLTDPDGEPLSSDAYSSPVICDIDGDGRGELLSGGEDGLIRQYRSMKTDNNSASLAFEAEGAILETGLPDCMIDIGDLNRDGVPDLAVGSRVGEMRVYFGVSGEAGVMFGDYAAVNTEQSWVSPCIYNGELYGGTLEGYVAHYEWNGESYDLVDYIEADTVSRRGNNRVTIGMNCVPRFADMDNDGADELVCGSLEYGMAYPIDSPRFPVYEELQEQIEFCKNNNIYIGIHGFTNKYASPEQEETELESHKTAFEKYNLPWDGKGANQHTWFTSRYGYGKSNNEGYNTSYNGTFKAQRDSGLLWNSGFTPPESNQVPQSSAENAIPMPIYMPDTDFLAMQVSNTPHGDGSYSYLSVTYNMPMLFYNHCDYIYDKEGSTEQKTAIKKVSKLVDDYDYMFVSEEQMAKAVAAAYNTELKAELRDGKIILSSEVKDMARGLYDPDFAESVGVRIVFADGKKAKDYSSDAAVQKVADGKFYVTLDRTVTISDKNIKENMSVMEINIPAAVTVTSDIAEIDFKEDGLMCVRVDGNATTSADGWDVSSKDGDTLFRKFGKAEKLEIVK